MAPASKGALLNIHYYYYYCGKAPGCMGLEMNKRSYNNNNNNNNNRGMPPYT